jgi:hypothetical protein
MIRNIEGFVLNRSMRLIQSLCMVEHGVRRREWHTDPTIASTRYICFGPRHIEALHVPEVDEAVGAQESDHKVSDALQTAFMFLK